MDILDYISLLSSTLQSEEEEDDVRHKIDLKALSSVIKLRCFLHRDIWFDCEHGEVDTSDDEMMTTGQQTDTNCLS